MIHFNNRVIFVCSRAVIRISIFSIILSIEVKNNDNFTDFGKLQYFQNSCFDIKMMFLTRILMNGVLIAD